MFRDQAYLEWTRYIAAHTMHRGATITKCTGELLLGVPTHSRSCVAKYTFWKAYRPRWMGFHFRVWQASTILDDDQWSWNEGSNAKRMGRDRAPSQGCVRKGV